MLCIKGWGVGYRRAGEGGRDHLLLQVCLVCIKGWGVGYRRA